MATQFSKYIFILWVLTLLFISCKSETNNKEADPGLANSPVIIDTNSARIGNFYKEYFSNGIVKAKTKYEIYTNTVGIVEKVFVSPGMHIESHSPICKLKNEDLVNEISIKSQEYEQSLIDLKDILLGWNFKIKDSLNIPKEIWEAGCIRSGYRLKKTELSILKTKERNLTIYAPFSGIVSNVKITEGQPLQTNELICNLSDISNLIAEFEMIEDDFFNISKNLIVQVYPYSNNEIFNGKIIDINPQIDENGLFKVRAEIKNSGLKLVDGMKVKVKILGNKRKALLVPKEALITRNKENIIFTYKQGKAIWNFVTVDDQNSTYCAISEGLKPNDIVITKGNLFLNQDSPVLIREYNK